MSQSRPTAMVVTSLRLPEDLRDQYLDKKRAEDPDAKLGKSLRAHMREVVEENERQAT